MSHELIEHQESDSRWRKCRYSLDLSSCFPHQNCLFSGFAQEITTPDEFLRDLCLMIANAIMYNGENAEISMMALDLKASAEQQFRSIFFHDSQLRRKSISAMSEQYDE